MTPEARLRQRVRFPVLALTAAAWVVLLLAGMPMAGPAAPAGDPAASPTHVVAGSAHQHALAAGAPAPLVADLGGAAVMLVAMMAPLLIPALRHVRDRSLPARRARAAALLTLGYALTWAAAWAGLVVLATALTELLGPVPALGAGLGLAVIWQVIPAKQRALNRCHARPPLAAFGWPADRDALRFGVRQASWCVGSCWSLMLLPLLVTRHSVLAMAVVAVWMWAERLETPEPVGWRVRVPARSVRILAAQPRAWARSRTGLRSHA